MTLTRVPLKGRLVRTVLGIDTSSWTYDDSTGAVTHYAAKHGATTLFDVLYTRDSLDRITQMEETVQGVTTVKAFTYDSVGRLDQVRVNGALTSDYDYDANGNRTSLTTQNKTVTGTYDDQDRMLTYGGAGYTYSANGELLMKVVGADTTRYSYNVLGSLEQVRVGDGTTVEYLFDGEGRRVGKRVDGVLVQGFVYQNLIAPVAEIGGNGEVVSRFIYATQANVPDYVIKGGVVYRVVTDHLGSVLMVVNVATGQIAQLRFFGSQPNLFAYAGANPLEAPDPLGLCPFCDQPSRGPVVFAGASGTLSLGAGGGLSGGLILWSPEGPGLYLTPAWGFGGDVGFGITVGGSTSLSAFSGKSSGVNGGFLFVSASGFTNEFGKTGALTIGPRVTPEETVYPISMSVQESYTAQITVKKVICTVVDYVGAVKSLLPQFFVR
jgi:hypothetical protein